MSTIVADACRQRARRAGIGFTTRESDVRMAEDGEVLVAVVEAGGEVAEAGAVGAGVAVREEGNVCAAIQSRKQMSGI